MSRDEARFIKGQRACLLNLLDEIGRKNPARMRQLRPAIVAALDAKIDAICAEEISAGERQNRIRAMIADAMHALQPHPTPQPQPSPAELRARRVAAIHGRQRNLPEIIPPDYTLADALARRH